MRGKWHLVHICSRSCSHLFPTCTWIICENKRLCFESVCKKWSVSFCWIEKVLNCQLLSSLHPGCQTWQTNRDADLWSRKLFEIFKTKPTFNVPCSFSLVRKGSPVVPSPSQVIMVPCVLPWRGAFSLKEFPWCWLCLFRHPLQCHNRQNILMTFSELVLGSIPHHSKHCQIAQKYFNRLSSLWPVG